MKRWDLKTLLFFSSLLSLTVTGTMIVGSGILFGEEEILPWIWLAGFALLFFNVSYLFVISVFSVLLKKKVLPEVYVQEFPKTAFCYFIRHEDTDLLYQRMDWSFQGNRIPNLDFWILSDSDSEFEAEELRLVNRLHKKYGNRLHYRRRPVACERKQGNIRDFVDAHPEYAFLYICDADSMVPKGTVLKLLKKALHSANQDIAIFQTFIRTANANTYYAKFEGIASETSQKLYFQTLQSLFGQTVSFGHHCLARRELLQRINPPKNLLSHDNWDTALLDQLGYRVVFVSDVITFDEVPAHYLETRKRESRWMQGTLQGWPLIFMKGLNPGVRFLSFYGIYCFLTQPVFLVWVLAGLLAQSYFWGERLSFGTNAIIFSLFANKVVYAVLVFCLLVVFFHKLVVVKNRADLKRFFYELFFSTLVYSGNFLYVTLDFLTLPLKKLIWRAMKKDPYERLSFPETVKTMFPGTILGIIGLWYIWEGAPYPKYSALPLLLSLALGIPIVFLSAKSISQKESHNP